MGLFKKILNAGEGRKLKLLQSIVPEVSRLELDLRGWQHGREVVSLANQVKQVG